MELKKENINKENVQPDKDELGNDARISQRILVKSSSIFSGSNSSSSSFMAVTMNSPKQQLVIISNALFLSDSDDSVKVPNYNIIGQRNVQIESSSDEERYLPPEGQRIQFQKGHQNLHYIRQ
ncbi:unnamed protein product [Parnassius apollo]|uniref:(apollo) hypothetical protein n=1 Tax=Parnassius apollo TaxID=110799 RepID=A0A8S3X7Y9_PARAO|nr:unnamed protein product [Parnassius apollo]